MSNEALLIIDTERGFMPTDETHTKQFGYGELPVPGGHEIIPVINTLADAALRHGVHIATTQDSHPPQTGHFAEDGTEPNFSTTWPRHCVSGTQGAELHPDLKLPATTEHFLKGMENLEPGKPDTSYSGFNAINPITNRLLPEWLQHRGVTKINIVGVALDHCVRATALDGKKAGLEVAVFLDAVRGVAQESSARTLQEFAAVGIEVTTSKAWLGQLASK